MARIDDIAAEVKDHALRKKLQNAIADLKKKQRFGLVFEEHIPEIALLSGLPIQPGATVQRRKMPNGLYRVVSVGSKGQAKIEPLPGGEQETAHAKDLLVVKRFGDPIYPALTPVHALQRAHATRPHHAVVNGENFHALQLFVYLYEEQVDCVYIDPPFNTGAKDWKYNNRYVDKNDSWRHSKWLSMMEKRLRLARRLLKPEGVLICMIDDHEVHHLGMLLEKVFPEYLRYMLTMVINPKGREKENFAPVGEYAFYMVPDTGDDVIVRAPVAFSTQPSLFDEDEQNGDEELSDEQSESDEVEEEDLEEVVSDEKWEYRHARRRGGGAESSSYRHKRWNQFYPIYIDEKERKVVRVGESIPLNQEPTFERVDGLRPIWPIDKEGRHRVWAFIPASMQRTIDDGNVLLGKYHPKRDDWTINYRVPLKETRKLKTVWWRKPHDAGTHGTELLKKFLGRPGLFPFPNSLLKNAIQLQL
jgi:adenine-specific DNA-methyltransferase